MWLGAREKGTAYALCGGWIVLGALFRCCCCVGGRTPTPFFVVEGSGFCDSDIVSESRNYGGDGYCSLGIKALKLIPLPFSFDDLDFS